MAAPVGNQFATRARVWRQAIERALERRSASRADGIKELDALADKLLDAVSTGDLAALKELGDRLDGRPAQAIVGDDDAPAIKVRGLIEFVAAVAVPGEATVSD